MVQDLFDSQRDTVVDLTTNTLVTERRTVSGKNQQINKAEHSMSQFVNVLNDPILRHMIGSFMLRARN